MHAKFSRRLPLSMLLGLTIAGVGIAAPSVPPGRPDDRLILIAESALHDVVARTDGVQDHSSTVPAQGGKSSFSNSDAVLVDAPMDSAGSANLSEASESGEGLAIRSAAEGKSDGKPTKATGTTGHFSAQNAVAKHELDDIRGGFSTSLNLTLSFGIERAVYLNGALVTTTNFNLPSLGASSRDGADGTTLAGGSIALVQNGPGNTFVQGREVAPLAATVLQNTLDNQTLQSLTTINTASNSLQISRTNAFQTLIQDGISRVLVPH